MVLPQSKIPAWVFLLVLFAVLEGCVNFLSNLLTVFGVNKFLVLFSSFVLLAALGHFFLLAFSLLQLYRMIVGLCV